MDAVEAQDWQCLPVEEVAERLGSTLRDGLAPREADERLAQVGPNELQAGSLVSAWRLLLGQFRNVLVLILVVAVALSAALGHVIEAIVIAVILVFAAVLGFVQEYRAEHALEALRDMTQPTAAVVREGIELDVPSREVVPGDVILLEAGGRVPADARPAEAVNLQVDEAALTGESATVDKQVEVLAEGDRSLAERSNMVHAGTTVTYGRGRAIVVATGPRTQLGAIAGMLTTIARPSTPLQRSLAQLGRTLARVALAVVVVIAGLGLARGQPLLDTLVFGVAVAVAVVPEALPAVVTISLALAAQRMARRHALIRRLSAVETLGSVSVIGTDKTGTLTAGQMTARRLLLADVDVEVSGVGYEPRGTFLVDGTQAEPRGVVLELLRAGALSSDAHLVEGADDGHWQVRGDPTEGALVAAAAKAGLHRPRLDDEHPRVGEIPFTSERKRMTTLCSSQDVVRAYSKGAPEVIVPSCTRSRDARGDERELTPARREAALASARALAERGSRVLAIATRDGAQLHDAETDMTLLGFVGLIDPPRPEARDAIERCRGAGIRPLMITGDHPLTARAIANELGILEPAGQVVTGTQLDAMTDAELAHDIEAIDVCARVSPAHKLRIVTALQGSGHIVAMTGDGVNDAPALKAADIGVAMGITGTDVSNEAAAMTLADDNFASIVAAIEEGRRVYSNIRKYLMYLLSGNLGEIGLVLGAALLGLPIPLLAVQILYVNLATDGLPALALAVDPPEHDIMVQRPRLRSAAILSRPVLRLILLGGTWASIVTLTMFWAALRSGLARTEAMTMTFATLVLIELLKAFCLRSERTSTFRSPFVNRWLNLAVLWEVTALALVVTAQPLQRAFRTTTLGLDHATVVALAAATIVPVLELGKWWNRRHARSRR